MDKQNKISVIVTFKDYYQNFEKCIYSLLNQTYGNIEIAVVNESPDDKKFNKAVKSITMAHPQVEVIGNDVLGDVQYSKHVAAAKFVKGKYVLFLPFAEVLTKNYIFDMVTKMEAEHACVAVSKMAFYFPKETIADLYSYEHQDYAKKKNNYSWAYTFLSGAPTFWGYYYLGNKVIERELLINVMATLPSVDMCNFGCGEDILLSYKIWTAAKNVVLSNEYVVLSWKNEDQLYSDVCSDASYKADKKLCSVVNYILGAVVNNKNIAERELVLKLLRAFVSRYMWRAGWAYEKTALAKAKIYLSDLLGVDDFAFEGEAKKMEDDNKYIDLSSSLDFEEHVSGEYKGKINIYVSMHKDSYVAPNKYLIPIQVGTALAEEEIPGVLHDNTGINISAKNKRYCELTAQYWAWKNVKDADYYGFWHYRRYFAFNLNLETNSWGNVHGDITQFYNLDFKENYLIASKEWYDIKNEPKDLFAEFDHIVDWDINEAANGRYFNSGVLLINLKKFRDDKIDVNYYVKKLSGLQNVFYDQGALCVCFAKQTLLLKTCIYNYRLAFSIPDFYNGENRYKNLIKTYKYYPIKAQIIHYCGNTGIKPWKLHLKQGDVPNSETAFLEIVPEYVPYIDIWWRYAELLPHETYLQIKEEADAQTAAYRMFWIIANARGYTFYNALHIDNLKAPEWGGRNNVVRGSDLNNYVVPKVYICGADISGTILNLPYEIKSGTPFRLTVKRLSSNTIGLTQILETDNDAMCIFVRHFGRQWGAWSIIASADFNERLVNLESKINEAEKIIQEYDLVKNSLSYKIGRFITYFPRKIYKLLRNK